MAKPSLPLINILRATARRLMHNEDYQWGHMGSCNCGFLAQEITGLGKHDIHRYAMQGSGDWNEQLNDYCPASGLPMDLLITSLLEVGFDVDDLMHLEKLSDRKILQVLPGDEPLRFNVKSDVLKYLIAWANSLERQLIESVELPQLLFTPTEV